MVTFYLYLIDVSIPLLFGLVSYIFFNTETNREAYILLYAIFSISILSISILKNYYKDYYLINFSEKIRISIITWIFSIFIQLIAHNYLLVKIDIYSLISWILIPIIILIMRYLVKINSKYITKFPIDIIGEHYKFNDHEINMLTNKGFIISFYSDKTEYFDESKIDKESVIVLNLSTSDLKNFETHKFKGTNSTMLKLDQFFERYLRKIYISPENILLNIKNYERSSYIVKRFIDYLSIIIILPILIITVTYMFIMKKIHDINESLFYKQKRYGLNNYIFNIYKLRTMYKDSESSGNTNKDDPRIYLFAKKVRSLRLDEMPQIINILIGHMHLVGPRAEWVKLSYQYDKKISNYASRHVVRPGITGWAQIAYPYGLDVHDAEQKLMYDLYYIKNWTIWLELEICFKTFLVILDKKGF